MKIPVVIDINEQENRRGAFRVEADGNVRMTINDEPVTLLDISETGIAFATEETLSGEIEGALILFETRKKYRFKPKLRVTFCARGRCGAEFIGLSERAHMALSELVVQLQKARIRHAKAQREENDGA
ncbi:PilZ domain-containing protein [uncultured Neptuniibacter sp.]|uniref:PilZ domain-containing protein n=1 Tax=uncultured Neptuniibacter sp. TaxID=502143 RepID=UPI00260A9D57|nr:PilZ domain-containing protein [uncultured Neptuniibacter sp.]